MSVGEGMMGAVQSVETPWEPGDRVAGYVLRTSIGHGGMSTVWDAWDVELCRCVALKVVEDPHESDALLNEARALAAVKHPGLPTVYALGVADRRRYLVLERLYGENLFQRLQRGPASFELGEALGLLITIADILHAVHQAGMVHHDVKPANIMLCREQRTVLLDFGVMLPEVRAAHAPRCGTPGYVAPEVVLDTVCPGRARQVDMYAFGVVAYEMFTGCPPSAGADLVALLENHAFAPPPDLRTTRADLPDSLGALVHACMAKDPDDRPADMDAVAGELRQLRRRLERRSATLPPHPRAQRGGVA
jgi:serine/threonine-protein kinase